MKILYVLAAILGTILPLSQLIPFLKAHGLDLKLFLVGVVYCGGLDWVGGVVVGEGVGVGPGPKPHS